MMVRFVSAVNRKGTDEDMEQYVHQAIFFIEYGA